MFQTTADTDPGMSKDQKNCEKYSIVKDSNADLTVGTETSKFSHNH